MNHFNKAAWMLPIILVFTFSSCEKDDPDPINEEEVITTLTYTLTPQGGGAAVVLSFQDLDGDGGNTPVITTGNLAANTTYSATLQLFNEVASPAEDITVEVLAEAADHQFFYASTSALNASVSYSDEDGDGNPVGVASTVTTGAASSGNLTITLRHEPDKFAAGVADGDIANAGGETDIEVTFSVTIQ